MVGLHGDVSQNNLGNRFALALSKSNTALLKTVVNFACEHWVFMQLTQVRNGVIIVHYVFALSRRN